jgi:hypothetical protein
VVYSPQIIENYQLKSGEGLSIAFVLIWLLGDLCNLAGARMAHLQSTIVILAAYVSIYTDFEPLFTAPMTHDARTLTLILCAG